MNRRSNWLVLSVVFGATISRYLFCRWSLKFQINPTQNNISKNLKKFFQTVFLESILDERKTSKNEFNYRLSFMIMDWSESPIRVSSILFWFKSIMKWLILNRNKGLCSCSLNFWQNNKATFKNEYLCSIFEDFFTSDNSNRNTMRSLTREFRELVFVEVGSFGCSSISQIEGSKFAKVFLICSTYQHQTPTKKQKQKKKFKVKRPIRVKSFSNGNSIQKSSEEKSNTSLLSGSTKVSWRFLERIPAIREKPSSSKINWICGIFKSSTEFGT